jgi:hypothetical protein
MKEKKVLDQVTEAQDRLDALQAEKAARASLDAEIAGAEKVLEKREEQAEAEAARQAEEAREVRAEKLSAAQTQKVKSLAQAANKVLELNTELDELRGDVIDVELAPFDTLQKAPMLEGIEIFLAHVKNHWPGVK